jgi:hypothetical protein
MLAWAAVARYATSRIATIEKIRALILAPSSHKIAICEKLVLSHFYQAMPWSQPAGEGVKGDKSEIVVSKLNLFAAL